MPKTLIEAQTAAAQSNMQVAGVHQQQSRAIPQTLIAQGLTAAETIDVEVSVDGGSTWFDMYQDGNQIQLTATNNVLTLYGPLVYRVSKGVTSGAAGCFLSTQDNP